MANLAGYVYDRPGTYTKSADTFEDIARNDNARSCNTPITRII